MKTKKYWLRGLLIGLLIGAIYFIVILGSVAYVGGISFAFLQILSPVLLILQKFDFGMYILFGKSCNGIECVFTLITTPISFMIEGLAIGWLYGKIKNRHKIS